MFPRGFLIENEPDVEGWFLNTKHENRANRLIHFNRNDRFVGSRDDRHGDLSDGEKARFLIPLGKLVPPARFQRATSRSGVGFTNLLFSTVTKKLNKGGKFARRYLQIVNGTGG